MIHGVAVWVDSRSNDVGTILMQPAWYPLDAVYSYYYVIYYFVIVYYCLFLYYVLLCYYCIIM